MTERPMHLERELIAVPNLYSNLDCQALEWRY
jgi:hypothetical protein